MLNGDLLTINNRQTECLLLRKKKEKYEFFKKLSLNNGDIIKKAVSFSENEFMIESKEKNRDPFLIEKEKLKYIFFDLNCKENKKIYLELYNNPNIKYDNDYIYINDFYTLFLINLKNKEVINIIQLDSIRNIIPLKYNKRIIIEENNAIFEYRIINKEIIKYEKMIENENTHLLAFLDDSLNTLIIKQDDYIFFLQ